MAKATKRKRPAARRPAQRKTSRLALSGWIVAAGVCIAWAAPHFGKWSEKLPDFGALPDQVATLIRDDERPSRPPVDQKDHATEPPESTRAPAARPASAAPPRKVQTEDTRRPALIPSISSDIKTVVAAKAEPKPAIPLPKPVLQSEAKRIAPMPPSSVPNHPPSSTPLVSAAIRRDATDRQATARPGELAIRRYPFTTAPAIAYVGDLRTLRIIGGQGDWKKIEVAASGQIGWLRLQHYDVVPSGTPVRKSAIEAGPKPAASLLREADATGSR